MEKELLLFQLGPVQEFIAQARSTRDLWSGSYMLSWLMAHVICAVMEKGGLAEDDVHMPSLKLNPLVKALRDRSLPLDLKEVLIPNLPNRALFAVPAGKGVELAEVAKQAVKDELGRMGEAVWTFLVERYQAKPAWKTRWDAQLKAFPQLTWAVQPWDGTDATWKDASEAVNRNLAVRRNTRDFAQWLADGAGGSLSARVEDHPGGYTKDSLSGREEAIGDDAFWAALRTNSLFNKAANHRYGALNLIKRLWIRVDGEGEDLACRFFADALNFRQRTVQGGLRTTSLPDIAKDNFDSGNAYVAVLAFDGDKMGDTVKRHATDPEGLRKVSQTLSEFALRKVRPVVEAHHGFLVYAGGDDVLALLPASQAVACARAVRTAFKEVGAAHGYALEGSCGLAIGHSRAPLQMLVEEARRMEQMAKGKYARGALAMSLFKRSGEILVWGTKWDEGCALDLFAKVAELTRAGTLPTRFPYALAELLRPYELEKCKWFGGKPDPKRSTSLTRDEMRKLVRAEFEHVLRRQGRGLSTAEAGELTALAEGYLVELFAYEPADKTKGSPGKTPHPEDFLTVFLAENFINRARGEEF